MPISVPLKKQRAQESFYKKNNIEDYKNKNIILVSLNDWEIEKFIIDWLLSIENTIIFVYNSNNSYSDENVFKINDIKKIKTIILDMFVSDGDWELTSLIPSFMKDWIINILPVKNVYEWVLTEFKPMQFTWNAFFYNEIEKFKIFAEIIIVLENIKYQWDKKILVKNITSTF